jgi:tetratricopeptide (TPR) repeat protein
MAVKDGRGEPVSNASQAALEGFERALAEFNGYVGDPVATISAVLEADPDFVLGHAFRAELLMLSTERAVEPELARTVARAEALREKANPRERGHIEAARAWADGDYQGAADRLDRVLIDHPRDLLALQMGHNADFFLGASANLRDRIARVLPEWNKGVPGYGYVLGMHSFGLEETGDYGGAAKAALRALTLNPKDSWAVHALAHVHEMRGARAEGIAWLEGRENDWAPGNFFAVHNWWHLALCYLDLGDVARGLALYDGPIRANRSTVALDLLDAASLLWRVHLQGVDCGARWDELAALYAKQAEDAYYAFNDVHAMMCFTASGRANDAQRLLAAQERRISEGKGSNAMMTEAVGLPVCQALDAFGRADYATTIEQLAAVRQRASLFGGSHAQRDVLALTLIEAALRGRQFGLARALANERLALKPMSPQNHRLRARVRSGLGDRRGAAAATARAEKLTVGARMKRTARA